MPSPTVTRMARNGRSRPAGWLATVRRLAAALLAVAAVTATTTGWLAICDEQVVGSSVREVCRSPQIYDGLTLAFALLLLLLVLPDLAEVGVPGLVSLRGRVDEQHARLEAETAQRERIEAHMQQLRLDLDQAVASTASARVASSAVQQTTVGGSTVNITLPGLASARLASPEPPDSREAPGPVTQARYAAAEYLLAHLVDEPPPRLGDARLNLFLPVDDGSRLLPALVTGDDRSQDSDWRAGEGVVGRAWQAGEPVTARGEEIGAGLEQLAAERRGRYGRFTVVVAVPVLNSAGRPIGVLSAVSLSPASGLDAPDCLSELLTRADVLARVLVDLLGWADDGLAPEPDESPRAPAAVEGGAEWMP